MKQRVGYLLVLSVLALLAVRPAAVSSASTTYYVSSSGGNDSNDGLSPDTAFKSVGKVNGLALQPGDRVLFKCGDTWRAEILTVSRSGAAGSPRNDGQACLL